MRNQPRTVAVLLLSLLTAPVVLTGCGGGDTDVESPAATASATVAESAVAGESLEEGAAAEATPFPANAEPDTTDASAEASVTVSDIRVARQDGFDRVVFEVGGTGTPGWDVRYVDVASSQGSGDEVDVAGNAVLQVSLTGAGYPYDTGVEEFSSSGSVAADDTAVVTEVVFDATYEGTTTAFVGTTRQVPFRVYLLEGPARVVVEVAHPS